ncbi:bifunctional hydroxymethylpyrimidine kinase/phosphomethylpyrimidine kinase [Candidatus Woesearchaeota archaeon]|nr:bifunctional hydroxymethylpyrimidine kinase/phosphomethylpyrimidine kinase [Candidatus Woesearchaeota archaeon]
MNDVLIIGTVAFDTIETPFGKVEKALGGSAAYASFAASLFSKPALISVVGNDFPKEHIKLMKKKSINIEGLQITGKTFHWDGFYEYDMNEAKTRKTELNSLEHFKAEVPENYKDIKYIFLANIDPEQQLGVLRQMSKPKFVVLDTMNFWINSKKKSVIDAVKKADVLLLNDAEARQLFGTANLVNAANQALRLGPKAVIIKKGEHGALLFTKNKHFNAPGYPLENIKDPTGCGDSFGGAFIGYLAKTKDLSESNFRKAVVYGSVVASHNAEDFGLNRLKRLTMNDIEKRYREFQDIREF